MARPRVEIVKGSLRAAIDDASSKEVTKILSKAIPAINIKLRELIRSAIKNSETVYSLLGYDITVATLQRQFGLTDEQAVSDVDKIIDAVVESVEITTKSNIRKGIVKEFIIEIAPETLQKQLASNVYYISEPSGSPIKWLEWLLFKGLTIVVNDYRLRLDKGYPNSRAGDAFMAKQDGAYYRVDSRFAGSAGDNFITRAIEEKLPEIIEIIVKTITQ